MHIVFFNTKGGVSKSTLCELSRLELQRLGYKVNVENTDQQEHVTLIENEDADFFLYDTAGAFTVENVDLLKAACEANALIIIPMKTGKNDLSELDFLLERLKEYNLLDKSKVVFTQTRHNSKSLSDRRITIKEKGLSHLNWTMPILDDFGEQRITPRVKNEISAFLHEVIL